MRHLFTLKTIMLACLLFVGMGAWAEADYTLTPSAGSNNSYTGNCDVTVGGITWNVTGNAQMTPWRIGGKSITNVDRTVYSKTAYTSAVSKIDLTVGAASSITVNSLKLVYSTNADFSNSSEISKTFAANSTISFEGNFPANAYYKFVFNVTVSVTSNKFLEFSKVEFYNKNTGGDPDPEPTKYTVTVANNIANGTVTASPTSAEEGDEVTLTATPNTGYEFGSWNVTNASTSAAITVTDNKFTMPAANVNVSATFNEIQSDEYTHDVLTNADFAATSTTYTDFSNVRKNTAVYAGNTSKNNGIQLRSNNNNSGIVSTTSGGKIKNVKVTWNSNCTSGRTIDVYGSNTAYASAADLYNNAKQGSKLGSIVMGTSTSVSVTGDYSYVGIRSNSGSLNINEIDFAWDEEGGDTPQGDPQISNFIKTANLNLETGADPYDVRNALNIPNDYDQKAYAITTTIDDLTQKDGEFACVYPYLSFQKAGSYTVHVTAAAMPGKYAETSGDINVTVKDPVNTVFASLEELAAADIPNGTEVTVSFENVPIKAFQTISGTRKGVYFDIQKGGNDIEIYFNSAVPAEWAVGGTLSGTMTNCPWKLYNSTWELAPASGWAWTNLTYNAPVQKTITALAVSGTPTKTTYNVGDAFETAGLVVTATYNDDTQAPIVTGFDWEIDYGTGNDALVAGATSVDVMVYTNEVMSEVYTVNGLTVNVPVTLTSIAVSGTPTKTEYYAGDAFETAGLVVTGTYSDSHQEVITEGIEWTVDPETLPLGATSVDVMASVGNIDSEVYTVNGLTVTENPYKTATISSFDAVSGDINVDIAYEAFKGNAGTAPAVYDNSLRLYQNGGYVTLTANRGLKINSVKISTSGTYASTTVGYCVDDEAAPTSGETVAKNSDYTISNLDNESVSIYCLGTDKNTRLEISAIEVKYSGNVVKELKSIELSGSYPTEFDYGDEFSHEGMTVTAIYTDGSNADVTSEATFTGYDMQTPGEQTVTVSYSEDEITKTAEYTITVNKAPFVPTPVLEGYESVDFTNIEPYKSTVTGGSTFMQTYEGTSFSVEFEKNNGTAAPKYYDNGKAVRVYAKNSITISGAENIMGVNVAWADTYADDEVSITGIGTTSAVVTFSNNSRFTAITVDYRPATINITSAGYATYVAPYNLDFTGSDVTAYLVEPDVENNVVHMTSVDMVPAGTAIVVKGAEGAHNDISTVAYVAPVTTALEVSATATAYDSEYTYYYLGQKNGQVGFRPLAEGGSIAAGKCFFKIAATGSARFMTIATEGETTGISAVENSKKNNAVVYNLAGLRVAPNAKGIVIVNGKKMLNK